MNTFPSFTLGRVDIDYSPNDDEFCMESICLGSTIICMTFDELEQIYTWAASVHESNHSE